MQELKIETAIFCDEVRREVNGSAIIIGARLVGEEIPREGGKKINKFALYFEAVISHLKSAEVRMFCPENDDEAFVQELDFEYSDELDQLPDDASEVIVNMVLVVNKKDVKISAPGEYEIQFKIPNGEWTTCKKVLFPSERVE